MALKIKDWDEKFEHAKSRDVDSLTWVRMPNSFDGTFFAEMMAEDDGLSLLACWDLLIRVASRAPKGLRGSLIKSDGTEHTARTIAILTRAPIKAFERAVAYFLSTGRLTDTQDTHAHHAHHAHHACPASPEATEATEATEGSGDETTEDNPRTAMDNDGTDNGHSTYNHLPHGGQSADSARTPGGYPADTGRMPGGQSSDSQVSPKNKSKNKKKTKDSADDSRRGELVSPSHILDPPDFTGPKPTPKDVLTVYDQIFLREIGQEYARTAAPKEAALASKIIKAVENTGGEWQRIPRAIEASFNDSFLRDKGFGVFAGQFAKMDIAAAGKGKKLNFLDQCIEQARNGATLENGRLVT